MLTPKWGTYNLADFREFFNPSIEISLERELFSYGCKNNKTGAVGRVAYTESDKLGLMRHKSWAMSAFGPPPVIRDDDVIVVFDHSDREYNIISKAAFDNNFKIVEDEVDD